MGVLREDRSTTTLEDAAAYERHRADHYGDDSRRPSLSDLAYDAMLDRIEDERIARREEVMRARGEYVPSTGMKIIVSATSMVLSQHCVVADVVAVRDGVMRLDGPDPLDPVAVEAALNDHQPGRYEVREANGTVWVRMVANLLGQPFTTADDDDPGPPF